MGVVIISNRLSNRLPIRYHIDIGNIDKLSFYLIYRPSLPPRCILKRVEMTTRVDIESFNCEELCLWLQKELIDDVGEEFLQSLRPQRIKGQAFLELTDEELKEIAPLLGERNIK